MSTTTNSLRIGNDPSFSLEDRRLGVGAEDRLECLDDLPLAGVYARAVEEVRHEIVVVAGGGFLEGGQLALDGGAVAAGADGLHAVDLLALQPRVDAEDLDLAVAALGVRVHADELARAVVVLLLELEGGVGDLALREAALDRLDHAAELVDLGEVRVRELLH